MVEKRNKQVTTKVTCAIKQRRVTKRHFFSGGGGGGGGGGGRTAARILEATVLIVKTDVLSNSKTLSLKHESMLRGVL